MNVLLHSYGGDIAFSRVPPNDRRALAQRFVAGLFTIHPLRVESVAWIAERKDVLSGFFFMLTLGCLMCVIPVLHRSRATPWS